MPLSYGRLFCTLIAIIITAYPECFIVACEFKIRIEILLHMPILFFIKRTQSGIIKSPFIGKNITIDVNRQTNNKAVILFLNNIALSLKLFSKSTDYKLQSNAVKCRRIGCKS